MFESNVLTYNNYRIQLLAELQRERIKKLNKAIDYKTTNYQQIYLEKIQKIGQVIDEQPLAVKIYFALAKHESSVYSKPEIDLVYYNFFPNYLISKVGNPSIENHLTQSAFLMNWPKNFAIVFCALPLLVVLIPTVVIIYFLDNRFIQLIENVFVFSDRRYRQLDSAEYKSEANLARVENALTANDEGNICHLNLYL